MDIPKISEIVDVSNFYENRVKNEFGFTLRLKDNSIKNIYIRGSDDKFLEELLNLKIQYNFIKQNLIKGEKYEN